MGVLGARVALWLTACVYEIQGLRLLLAEMNSEKRTSTRPRKLDVNRTFNLDSQNVIPRQALRDLIG